MIRYARHKRKIYVSANPTEYLKWSEMTKGPGQFEGEAPYVPYYWDAYLNGCADRDDGKILGFDVSGEDKQLFPMLRNRRTVRLMQRDDGFVIEV